jgi:hypothetical protein
MKSADGRLKRGCSASNPFAFIRVFSGQQKPL